MRIFFLFVCLHSSLLQSFFVSYCLNICETTKGKRKERRKPSLQRFHLSYDFFCFLLSMTLVLNDIGYSSPFLVLMKNCWKCKRPQTFLAVFDFLQPFLGYTPELFYFLLSFLKKTSEGDSFYSAFKQVALERAELSLFEVTASKNIWRWSGGSRVTGDIHVGSVLTVGTAFRIAKTVYRKMRSRRKCREKSHQKSIPLT